MSCSLIGLPLAAGLAPYTPQELVIWRTEHVNALIFYILFLYLMAWNLAVEQILNVLQSDRATSRR